MKRLVLLVVLVAAVAAFAGFGGSTAQAQCIGRSDNTAPMCGGASTCGFDFYMSPGQRNAQPCGYNNWRSVNIRATGGGSVFASPDFLGQGGWFVPADGFLRVYSLYGTYHSFFFDNGGNPNWVHVTGGLST